jgi:ABC-type multidrug transport system fused ATPase/permease subunit
LGGIGTGLFFFIQYVAYSFGFWYGVNCVAENYRCTPDKAGQVYTPGNVITVFFAIFVGSYNFLQIVPSLMAILEGLKAAKRMYSIIDMLPTIKNNKDGLKK